MLSKTCPIAYITNSVSIRAYKSQIVFKKISSIEREKNKSVLKITTCVTISDSVIIKFVKRYLRKEIIKQYFCWYP